MPELPQAVTLDANGTVIRLRDPVPRLARELAARGVHADAAAIRRALAAEVSFYVPRAHEGRDERSLARLQREAIAVFLTALPAPLELHTFVAAFLAAVQFEPVAGARPALAQLRAAGIRLACVANWDVTLTRHLEHTGLAELFDAVVSSAEAGAPKPATAPFRLALARLAVPAERALHVGDDEVDRKGAAAAGLAFAPPPVVTLPARLGLETGWDARAGSERG